MRPPDPAVLSRLAGLSAFPDAQPDGRRVEPSSSQAGVEAALEGLDGSVQGALPCVVPAAGGWVPPASLVAHARALMMARLPGPLRGGRWDAGRGGALAVAGIGAVALALAVLLLMHGRARVVAPARPLHAPVTAAAATSAATSGLASSGAGSMPGAPSASGAVVVDVEGRVAHPGLRELAPGARVASALAAAGGPLPGTDTTALDLARRVVDGEQLRVGLPGAAAVPGQPMSPGGPGSGPGPTSPIDLNSATAADLDSLPGVGPVTAQHILAWRQAHGRFDSVDQLREVAGIGPLTYAQLAPLVRV